MARDRERACIYYVCENECLKGHDGTFRDTCQICKDYVSSKKGRVKRGDYRKEKREKIYKKENDIRNFL